MVQCSELLRYVQAHREQHRWAIMLQVHRTDQNCSIYFQGIRPNNSQRVPIHGAGAPRIATLQPCAAHTEPWAGQVHVLSATQANKAAIPSGKSGLRNAKTAHAETAKFGFKWLSEQIKHWDVAVKQLANCTGVFRCRVLCIASRSRGVAHREICE